MDDSIPEFVGLHYEIRQWRHAIAILKLDVGVIVTRCDHLQRIFDDLGRGDSYGASTTHMRKLLRD